MRETPVPIAAPPTTSVNQCAPKYRRDTAITTMSRHAQPHTAITRPYEAACAPEAITLAEVRARIAAQGYGMGIRKKREKVK